MEHAFEPGVANQPEVRMPSDVDRPPPSDVLSRTATEAERVQYGITHPLRQDLVEAINDGLSLEDIAERYGATARDVASKLMFGWVAIARLLPEASRRHGQQLRHEAAEILGKDMPHAPMTTAADALEQRAEEPPAPAPEKREEESNTTVHRRPRRTWEQIQAALPPEKLAQELEAKPQRAVAQDNGIAVKTLHALMTEYGIEKQDRRREKPKAAPKPPKEPSAAEQLPLKAPKALNAGSRRRPHPRSLRSESSPGGGLSIRVARFGEPSAIVQHDLQAVLGVLEQAGRTYNLMLTLEEAV